MNLTNLEQIDELIDFLEKKKSEMIKAKTKSFIEIAKDQESFQKWGGVNLDLGCGDHKQPGYVGLDKRTLEHVDVVHDVEDFPWPVPDNYVFLLLASHLLEHIKPWKMIGFMEEAYRVLKPNGQFLISCPYALSTGDMQDPTHIGHINPGTFCYFDPDHFLYSIYKPNAKFKIRQSLGQLNGNLEVILEPVKSDKTEKE